MRTLSFAVLFRRKEGECLIRIIKGLPCQGDRKQIVAHIADEVERFQNEWAARLSAGESGRSMEWSAVELCMRFAGWLVALVWQDVGAQLEAQAREDRPDTVESPRRRRVRVALPGGAKVEVETLYCAPKRGRGKGGRGREGGGLYPEWARLGIFEGASAALSEMVLLLSLLMPSFERARGELERLGTPMNGKTVRRVVYDMGRQALSARQERP